MAYSIDRSGGREPVGGTRSFGAGSQRPGSFRGTSIDRSGGSEPTHRVPGGRTLSFAGRGLFATVNPRNPQSWPSWWQGLPRQPAKQAFDRYTRNPQDRMGGGKYRVSTPGKLSQRRLPGNKTGSVFPAPSKGMRDRPFVRDPDAFGAPPGPPGVAVRPAAYRNPPRPNPGSNRNIVTPVWKAKTPIFKTAKAASKSWKQGLKNLEHGKKLNAKQQLLLGQAYVKATKTPTGRAQIRQTLFGGTNWNHATPQQKWVAKQLIRAGQTAKMVKDGRRVVTKTKSGKTVIRKQPIKWRKW